MRPRLRARSPERQAGVVRISSQFATPTACARGSAILATSILSEANTESEAPRWFRALVSAPAKRPSFRTTNGGTESIILVAGSGGRDRRGLGRGARRTRSRWPDGARRDRRDEPPGRARSQALGVAGAALCEAQAGDYSARAEGDGPPEIPRSQWEDQFSRGAR
jgi:hypothetical protein